MQIQGAVNYFGFQPVGNLAMQRQQEANKNKTALPNELFLKLGASAAKASEDIIAPEMQAKLDELNENKRIMDDYQLTSEDMKLAKETMSEIRKISYGYAAELKEYQEEAQGILQEKTLADNLLNGTAESPFAKAAEEDKLELLDKYEGNLNALAMSELSEKERSAAYAVYGNEYLKARSDFLGSKLDQLKQKVEWSGAVARVSIGSLQSAWNEKFGDNPALVKLMEKLIPGAVAYVSADSADWAGDLTKAVDAMKVQLEQTEKVMKEFDEKYSIKKTGEATARELSAKRESTLTQKQLAALISMQAGKNYA